MLYLYYKGGGDIYALVSIIFSLLCSYFILSYYFVIKKSKIIFSIKTKNIPLKKLKFLNPYILKINNKLFNLGYPYGLNFTKYFIIKYIFSVIAVIVLSLRGSNIFTILLYFTIVFYLPQFIIFIYSRKERNQVIESISYVIQSMILSKSSNMSTYDALIVSSSNIPYKRFKIEFEDFIQRYKMYNYEFSKASTTLIEKFNCYELKLFLSTIVKSDKEGELEENLEAFFVIIEPLVTKNKITQIRKSSVYITAGAMLLLLNTFAIIMYPIGMQIFINISDLLK